jgi:hypothetical protein
MLNRPFSLLLTGLTLLASLHLGAAQECSNSVKLKPKSGSPELFVETQSFRNQKLTLESGQYQVRGKNYSVLGRLGKSSSIAYLVKDDSGQLFVLKEIKSDDQNNSWAFSANYEVAATEFYTAMGFTIPKVIALQYKKEIGKHTTALLIKEYRPGVTVAELQGLSDSSKHFWVETSKIKLRELPEAMKRLRQAHEKFRDWLNTHDVNLYEKGFEQLPHFIEKGDIVPENMLLDAQTGQWILFDP